MREMRTGHRPPSIDEWMCQDQTSLTNPHPSLLTPHSSPLMKRPGAVADHLVFRAGGVAGGAQIEALDCEPAGPCRRQETGRRPAAATCRSAGASWTRN